MFQRDPVEPDTLIKHKVTVIDDETLNDLIVNRSESITVHLLVSDLDLQKAQAHFQASHVDLQPVTEEGSLEPVDWMGFHEMTAKGKPSKVLTSLIAIRNQTVEQGVRPPSVLWVGRQTPERFMDLAMPFFDNGRDLDPKADAEQQRLRHAGWPINDHSSSSESW